MKKSILNISTAILLGTSLITASAQISRAPGATDALSCQSQTKCLVLKPDVLKKIRPSIASGREVNPGLRFIDDKGLAPRLKTNRANAGKSVAKTVAKATGIQGYCLYTGNAGDTGWYTVDGTDTQLKWKRPTENAASCGFMRGSELYAFYSRSTSSSGLTDAGLYIQDVNTGKVKESIAYQIFDTAEQVTCMTAFDKSEDIAYVVTLNKTGEGYLFQEFDPKTKSYTNLGVTPPADWLDMAWNPADKSVYILCEDGSLRKYDSKAKRFNLVISYEYDMTDYPNDMVYSPKDDAFYAMLDSYDEDGYPCTDAVLLSLNGKVTYLGTLSSNMQFSILEIADEFINSDAPKAAVLKAWSVDGPELSGEFTVTLPSEFENGNAISSTLRLSVKIDDKALTGTFKGNAGADVTVPVSATEGLHRINVTPYILTDDGQLYGTPLIFDRYFGNDVPAAPRNVTLAETQVTWEAVTSGEHGGYVDASAVKYNVSIDGIRMNTQPVSGTSLDITMPESGKVAHKAEVVAVVGDKSSTPGVSGNFYGDGALSLPVFIAPEDGSKDLDPEIINMFTVVKDALNTEELRGWRYDDQTEHTGGFYCLAPKVSSAGATCDEWLFLPAIKFTDKNAHYRFSMDVWSGNHYFTTDEIYEVVIAQRPTGKRTTVIREATTVYKNQYFELSETLFQVPEEGEWYIGIHYISPLESYRLYARNFKIEKAEASSDSPAAVVDLDAAAAPLGELKANLTFKMPAFTISGAVIPAATVITAKAETKAGQATVTGTPGQTVTLAVPTVQGDNTIRVTTSSEAGIGLTAEVVVYTGVYRPGKAFVEPIVSDDNQTLTLNIELDDYNENNEYAGADACDVTIYRKVADEWRVAAEIGKNRTWTFECPEPTKQDLYSFGILPRNVVGEATEMVTFGVHLGKLVSLPMNETFPSQGEAVTIIYEPISIEQISGYAEWGFCNPSDIDEAAANASGVALYATWEAESQIILPRFSTADKKNVKMDMSMFFGNKTPEAVTVFASSPDIEMEPAATFTRESGQGWEHKLISLPAACQNKPWVQITLRVKLKGYSQFFLMDSYSITEYPEEMITITGIKGRSRGTVGESMTYKVELENAGTKTTAIPEYSFKVLGDNGIVADLKDAEAPTNIAPGKKAELTFSFVPKAADKGSLIARFNMNGQPSASVSEIDKQILVLNAPVPVVDDLVVNCNAAGDVTLSWSKPMNTETFEAFEPWAYEEEMRGFANIDLDKGKVWSISEVNYDAKTVEKAFQVFSSSITDNPILAAHSGEQYLLGMSSSKGKTDDWLISPEVKGGSKMSFWMNICDPQYPEVILVKYSTAGKETHDFKDLDGGYICPDKRGWAKFEFTLPDDAKYFALNHVADDGNEQFGMMLDDISFEPTEGAVVPESYNVYRDNELIASNLDKPGYVDKNVNVEEPVRYFVKTVSTVNGEKVESDRSNVVWAKDESALETIDASNSNVRALREMIEISGFDEGTPYHVFDATGREIASGVCRGVTTSIHISSGFYVVRCGNKAVRLIVK